jgi:hypothetical protein
MHQRFHTNLAGRVSVIPRSDYGFQGCEKAVGYSTIRLAGQSKH